MLVHRIVVIHVELHHRHDAAERAHELAKHTDLVHPPQHDLGIVLGGEDLEEQPVGLLVGAQLVVDELKRARDRAHGVGMEGEAVFLRQIEDADQVDRIAREDIGVRKRDAIVVDDEIVGLDERAAGARAQTRHHAIEHRHRLRLPVLELGAQDGGEVADILGDQEVVLHEALDVALARMRGVAEPHRDLALDVEGQPLLGAAGEEMHVATNCPQEVAAAAEAPVFARIVDAELDQLLALAHAIDIFGDPVERVQVAQAAFAVLDVGLHEIA